MSAAHPTGQATTDAPMPTRLFVSGNSQAVCIPKALAFPNVALEVEIERRGDELIVRPARRKLSGLGEAFRRLRPYFQSFRRDQPEQDERDWRATEISGKRSR